MVNLPSCGLGRVLAFDRDIQGVNEAVHGWRLGSSFSALSDDLRGVGFPAHAMQHPEGALSIRERMVGAMVLSLNRDVDPVNAAIYGAGRRLS